MPAADLQLGAVDDDAAAPTVLVDLADVSRRDEGRAVDADKSCRGPLLLEGGERDAHEVRAGGGVQPRVVTLGLDPADVAAGDEAGDPAELDRDGLRVLGR
ncbi:hypothetical protein B277_04869 [Janibacter hoylei PVAS-1]|uniref:Uncharacterized protein n=1 Tax=Janibacter hoylei PVAS-1 TaxID=1210046 RepID=K1E4D0_9MICO|nr:hypothetical protein B277_04869 [Janibacter hoylei PVAS-1]